MIQDITEFLIQNSVVSVVFGVLILTLTLFVRRKPGLIHFACVLALTAMLTPPLFLIPLPGPRLAVPGNSVATTRFRPQTDFSLREIQPSPTKTNSLPAERDILNLRGESPSRTKPDSQQTQVTDQDQPNSSSQAENANLIGSTNSAPGPHKAGDSSSFVVPWTAILSGLWATGSFLYLLWTALQIWRFRRLMKSARQPAKNVLSIAGSVSREFGLHRTPEILELDHKISPLVTLSLHGPTLVIPKRLLEELSDAEIRGLVMHELAHVRRLDPWVRILELVNVIVFWPNPVLWWIRQRLKTTEELACDAMVVQSHKADAEVYARAFLKTVDFLSTGTGNQPTPIVCTMNGFRHCERRLTAMLTQSQHAKTPGLQITTLLLICLPFLLGGVSINATGLDLSLPDRHASTRDTGNQEATDTGTAVGLNANNQETDAPNVTAPKIVSCSPADGEKNVPLKTVIRIRFDQPMSRKKLILKWTSPNDNPAGYRLAGTIKYDPERFEFSIPVFLEPDRNHQLAINRNEHPETPGNRFYPGFVSDTGVAAGEFSWSFDTSNSPPSADGPVPTVVSISPKPNSEIGLSTTLKIAFDQPMDPEQFEIERRNRSWHSDFGISGNIDYDPSRNEFSVPITFQPNWNGDLNILGLRSANGVTAEPLRFVYRTMRTVVSAERKAEILENGKSEKLAQLIEEIKKRYAKLTAVKVDVVSTSTAQFETWGSSLEVTRCTFARDGKKYFGDVSAIMNMDSFRMGSNGKDCWARSNNEVTICPTEQMHTRNVAIGDPFGGLNTSTITDLITGNQLEYLGMQELEGRRYHRIRGNAYLESNFASVEHVGNPVNWYFDVDTLLLMRMSQYSDTVFEYQPLDQPIAPELFAPPRSDSITETPLQPLQEGYTHRFLGISDSSNGRMSLRWGQRGPNGIMGGGLN